MHVSFNRHLGCLHPWQMNEENYLSYIMEYYKILKRKEMLAFVTTWMKLEDVILSEISQIDKDKYYTV